MSKIKTSELITKFALASEEACKCEDENFFRVTELEKLHNPITPKDLVKVIRATTEIKGIWLGNYEHESGITLEKILLDVIENDVDVFNNDDFRNTLAKALNVK